MEARDLRDLVDRSVAVLRLQPEAWAAIATSRRQGERFSLNFPHDEARYGERDGLVIIVTPEGETLRLGVVTSIGATATLDSRVVFDLVSPILPASFEALVEAIETTSLRAPIRGLSDSATFERVSPALGEAMIARLADEPDNGPAIARILTHLRRPKRIDDARAMQRDAVALAFKMFGAEPEAARVALPGAETALGVVRLREDAVIEHDARWVPGWRLDGSDLTGRASFERRGERLEIFTANKQPLEQLFGVDLIYLNARRRAIIMVQYKMLEPDVRLRRRIDAGAEPDEEADGHDWIARIDGQFEDELYRMRRFDRDLDPDGDYRLNCSAFFFKFVRRYARANAAGIILSLGHLDRLLEEGRLAGARGGLRISYQSLEGHYLRSDPFVELVRSGYVGTHNATTDHLEVLIDAALRGGRAVVAGLQAPA